VYQKEMSLFITTYDVTLANIICADFINPFTTGIICADELQKKMKINPTTLLYICFDLCYLLKF